MNRQNLSSLFFVPLAFSLFLNLPQSLTAQQYQAFPTDTASWQAARCWYLFGGGWNDQYRIFMDGSDTLYMGETFKKLYIDERQLHGSFDSTYPTRFFGGIREENKQVWMFQKWASVDTTSHLVYDFTNTTIGDTIYTSALSGPPTIMLGHLITATDSVLVDGVYHKRLHLEDPSNSFNTEYWIEGVGSSWGLPFASFWSITDNSYDLICYNEYGYVRYQNTAPTFGFCTPPLPNIICDTMVVGVDEELPENSLFGLFPNPATESLRLVAKEATAGEILLEIVDVKGMLVHSTAIHENEAIIDISGLPNGIYMALIRAGDQREVHRIIVRK